MVWLGTLAHSCNLKTQAVEAAGLREASLGYPVRSCFKTTNEQINDEVLILAKQITSILVLEKVIQFGSYHGCFEIWKPLL